MMWRAAEVIDHTVDQFALTLDCTPSLLTSATDDTAILDYGFTINFLSAAAPCTTSIQLSYTNIFLLSALPHKARKAQILPRLVHTSLISVGQLYDSGCNITFTREKVEVTKVGYAMCYVGATRSRVNLKEDKKPACKAECNHAHENSNKKYLINYLHAACFSPVNSTWINAIKNGNFTLWPGLTEQSVVKHLSKSTTTVT
jgi:hypothetical protein